MIRSCLVDPHVLERSVFIVFSSLLGNSLPGKKHRPLSIGVSLEINLPARALQVTVGNQCLAWEATRPPTHRTWWKA